MLFAQQKNIIIPTIQLLFLEKDLNLLLYFNNLAFYLDYYEKSSLEFFFRLFILQAKYQRKPC